MPAARHGVARLLAPDVAVKLTDLRQHPGGLEILPTPQLGPDRPVVVQGALQIRDGRRSGHARALTGIASTGKARACEFPHVPSKCSTAVAG
jgi:hypothetical protein